MSGQGVKTRPAHIFIEREIGSAALASAFDVFIKDPADEQSVIADVRPDEKGLVGSSGLERQQKVRQIKSFEILDRCSQLPNKREIFQKRPDIVCQQTIVDARSLQNESSQNIEVKLRRNGQVAWSFQHSADKSAMIQNLVPGLHIRQQLDQTHPVSRAFRECPNDKIEIFPGKSCPTVRLNHRVYLHSIIRAG